MSITREATDLMTVLQDKARTEQTPSLRSLLQEAGRMIDRLLDEVELAGYGQDAALSDGYSQGWDEGYSEGYSEGWDHGLAEGVAEHA